MAEKRNSRTMFGFFQWEKEGDESAQDNNISSSEALNEPVDDVIVQSDNETQQVKRAKYDHPFQQSWPRKLPLVEKRSGRNEGQFVHKSH